MRVVRGAGSRIKCRSVPSRDRVLRCVPSDEARCIEYGMRDSAAPGGVPFRETPWGVRNKTGDDESR